jgi:hypothetical protein
VAPGQHDTVSFVTDAVAAAENWLDEVIGLRPRDVEKEAVSLYDY